VTTVSEPTILAGASTASPWADIRCVGGFESASGGYWPSHLAPILVEVDAEGRWRRWRYAARPGSGVSLLEPVGAFTNPEAASFLRGGYLTCEPLRFGPASQLLALPGPRLVVCRTPAAAVRVLLRVALTHGNERAVLSRCLRGIRNALADRPA
jgi:hypothetical protein